MNRFAIAIALAACGRIGFDIPDATATDAGVDSSTMPCEPAEWSETITRLANLSVDDFEDWEATVSPDELTIVFSSYRGTGFSQLFVSTRPTRDADFAPSARIPEFGSRAGDHVYGPTWSIDGRTLYFYDNVPREVEYLGGGVFGDPIDSDLPGFSAAFANENDVYTTTIVQPNDYDLERWTRAAAGSPWVQRALPPAYNRNMLFANDGWPGVDRGRQELYFERETNNEALIARARHDAAGELPEMFETLTQLGNDLSDPDLSPDGLRMYVSSRRREGTDNDIYMFERACE